jgi:IS605 OrfB family transposase
MALDVRLERAADGGRQVRHQLPPLFAEAGGAVVELLVGAEVPQVLVAGVRLPAHKFASRRLLASAGRGSDAPSPCLLTVSVYNVGMKLTVQIKLIPTPEQAMSLRDTTRAMNEAATHAAAVGFAHKVYGQVSIHNLCYRELREKFSLGAQHAVRAISKAVEAFSHDKAVCPVFRLDGAIPLDDRLYRLIGLQQASINTTNGRIKVPFVVGDYFTGMLTRKIGQADLVLRDGQFFLYVTVEFEEELPVRPVEWVGVDLGIVNLATDSTGEQFSGEGVNRNRRRRATGRKQYQRKGTRSAKRRLRRMSGRQARYQRWVNHNISKRLVDRAKARRAGIVLEDLKHIRSRLETASGRASRRRFGNWSFAQLHTFVEYKARRAGVPVLTVNPRNTSRTCSRCGHCAKGNRKTQDSFVCLHCGYSANADLNAAKNLSSLGAPVTCPQK